MATQITPQTKVIYWPTNHNNKLACEFIVHVDLAPAGSLTENDLESRVIEIRTYDNSYPPSRWKLIDLCRLRLSELTSIITWPSHGMQSFEFARWFILKNNTNMFSNVSVYYYQRIADQ